MMNDLISTALTHIRNAQRAGHKTVQVPSSKAVKTVLEVLRKEGFVQSTSEATDEQGRSTLEVSLKYYSNGQPLIATARRVSKPGRRVYAGVSDIPLVSSGLGIMIVSTSKGVLSDREARAAGVGGELIASVA